MISALWAMDLVMRYGSQCKILLRFMGHNVRFCKVKSGHRAGFSCTIGQYLNAKPNTAAQNSTTIILKLAISFN
jgi:hypothetical protein